MSAQQNKRAHAVTLICPDVGTKFAVARSAPLSRPRNSSAAAIAPTERASSSFNDRYILDIPSPQVASARFGWDNPASLRRKVFLILSPSTEGSAHSPALMCAERGDLFSESCGIYFFHTASLFTSARIICDIYFGPCPPSIFIHGPYDRAQHPTPMCA